MAANHHSSPWGNRIRETLRDVMPLVALLLVICIFATAGWKFERGRFFTFDNSRLILCDSAIITVSALGMMLIIAVGGIDLSAGAILGLCTAVLACALKRTYSPEQEQVPWHLPLLCLLLTVGVGALAGGLNGILINTFRVTPFMVTLGAMAAYYGLAMLLADEKTVVPHPTAIPTWLRTFVSHNAFGWYAPGIPKVPLGIAVEIVLALVLAFVIHRTVFGRHIIAVGANEQAARLCGIRVGVLKIAVYLLGGACFGLAAVCQFANVLNYSPGTGQGKELDIIAAVVIGGGSLKGGRASVIGTFAGSLLMATIRSGCTQLGIGNPYQLIIIGLIIIGAVLFDRATGRAE